MTPRPGFPFGSADPAQELRLAFQAAADGRWTSGQVFELAASRELALAATDASCAALAEFIRQMASDAGKAAFPLAYAVERHASMLDDLGRPDQALRLYDAILPVCRQHAPPELLAGVLN